MFTPTTRILHDLFFLRRCLFSLYRFSSDGLSEYFKWKYEIYSSEAPISSTGRHSLWVTVYNPAILSDTAILHSRSCYQGFLQSLLDLHLQLLSTRVEVALDLPRYYTAQGKICKNTLWIFWRVVESSNRYIDFLKEFGIIRHRWVNSVC